MTVLIIFLSALAGFLFPWIVLRIIAYIRQYQNNNEFLRRQQLREDLRDKGELNEWITVDLMGQKVQVDKKTGWAPALEGFIPDEIIESQAKIEEEHKRYDIWKSEQYQQLSKEFGITEDKLDKLIERISSMTTDYFQEASARLAKEQKDMVL